MTTLTLSTEDLERLIETGSVEVRHWKGEYAEYAPVILKLDDALASGLRAEWRKIVLAVARRVPEASL